MNTMKLITSRFCSTVIWIIAFCFLSAYLQCAKAETIETRNLGELRDGYRNGMQYEIPSTTSKAQLDILFSLSGPTFLSTPHFSTTLYTVEFHLYKQDKHGMEEYAMPYGAFAQMHNCYFALIPAGNYLLRFQWTYLGGSTDSRICLLGVAADALPSSQELDTPIAHYPISSPEPIPEEAPAYGGEPTSGVTAGRSYIRERIMLTATADRSLDAIHYFDGLGRSIQTVRKGFTPLGADLVDYMDYDSHGRPWREWLPTPVSGKNGAFINNLPLKAGGILLDSRPYRETHYDPTMPEEPYYVYAPGADWVAHPMQMKCLVNTNEGVLACSRYQVASDGRLQQPTAYPAGELLVNKATDEDGRVSYNFTDKQGTLILSRQMNGSNANDTYQVYDAYHRLRYVLPPMVGADISDANLDKYAFRYSYDNLHRLVEKKLPGCAPQKFVYDAADRIILTQDGNQAARQEWTCNIPDAFGRIVLTGLCKAATQPALGSAVVKAELITLGSGVTGVPGSGYYISNFGLMPHQLLTIHYYDTYSFLSLPAVTAASVPPYQALSGYDKPYTYASAPGVSANGKLTGSRVFLMDGSGKEQISAFYYDAQSRVVQCCGSDYFGGLRQEFYAYTFTGSPLRKRQVHTLPGKASQTEVYNYTYDASERLLKVTHQLNGGTTVTLAENSYDEQGRVKSKQLHGGAAGTSTYAYNIRNWLTGITHPQFTQKLHYTTGVGTPCYNGNISSMTWKVFGTGEPVRGYKFSYDGLSRLTLAAYGEGDAISLNPGRFSENITAYDKQGNIKTLQRYGKISASGYGILDNLTFVHHGNQLKSVSDAAADPTFGGGFNFVDGNKLTAMSGKGVITEYIYDVSGNLTQDFNKKIAKIQYNILNLPNTLQFTNGNTTGYLYGADGSKRRVTHQTASGYVAVPMGSIVPLTSSQIAQTTTTDYCGNVIYENGALGKILTEEGYITLSGTTPTYHYYLRDHQGNNRVVMSQSNVVEQVNHYYPFGGLFAEGTDTSKQAYKYNGKELDKVHGLNWYDFGNRSQEPMLARFNTMDRFSEKYYSLSPYQHAGNNPVNNIDINGDSIWFTSQFDKNNELVGVTMHITGKVLNDSNEKINIESATNSIATAMRRTYSGEIGGISFNTDIQLSSAKSMEDVSGSDHLFVLSNKISEVKDGEIYGASNYIGGKVAFVNAAYFSGAYDEALGSRNYGSFTATHEFGHLSGLGHSSNPFNVMRSNGMFYGIATSQLKTIYSKWGNGKLNCGSNYILNPLGGKRPNVGNAGVYVKPW